MFQRIIGKKIEDTDTQSKDLTQGVSNLIFQAYKLGKLSTEFPQLHINSGIHAAIRYKNHTYNKGDFYDHLNASVALPYCDLFLTERVMGNLLTDKLLEYDKVYNCQVLWKDEEILEILKKL